jgi:hypothetical protein
MASLETNTELVKLTPDLDQHFKRVKNHCTFTNKAVCLKETFGEDSFFPKHFSIKKERCLHINATGNYIKNRKFFKTNIKK